MSLTCGRSGLRVAVTGVAREGARTEGRSYTFRKTSFLYRKYKMSQQIRT